MWYLNSVVYPCYLVDSFLTKDECLAITNEYSDKVEESKVVGNIINKKIRKSDNFWIPVDETTEWLYRKLTDGITFVNKKNFNFDLFGFHSIQFTKYEGKGSKYGRHSDTSGPGIQNRKLSISILLNDPSEYEGGDLILYEGARPIKSEMKLGTLVAFPSYMTHEVTPIIKGTRYTLVTWVEGPPFR